ncbi:MAG: hypothetical protein ABIM21_06610 [candidate division WOR-3 bacterium]
MVLRIVFMFFILILTGCGLVPSKPSSLFIDSKYDFGSIKRIAVLPFENLTEDRQAGEVIRYMVINQIQEVVETVPVGDVESYLKRLNITSVKDLTTEQMQRLCRDLKADAVVTGTVYKYGEVRFGNISAPEVSLSIVMMEPESGAIIWSVTAHKTSANFWVKYFGAGSETLSETAFKVVRDAVNTFKKM